MAIPERFQKAFKTYDTDGNGKLSQKEIDALPDLVRERVLEYIRSLPEG